MKYEREPHFTHERLVGLSPHTDCDFRHFGSLPIDSMLSNGGQDGGGVVKKVGREFWRF